MKFCFVRAEKARYGVPFLCRILGVSKSGYYAWAKRELSAHSLRDAMLRATIVSVHRDSRGTYGSPRVLSDRGSQYTSDDYQRMLREAGITCSMSGRGNCYDNAVAESFFGTLKRELIYRRSWATRNEAAAAIHEYIEVFYNRQRRHSTLGGLNPADHERRTALSDAHAA